MSEPSQPYSYTFEVPSRPEAWVVTRRKKRPYWLHLLLLLLTMVTTLAVGAAIYDNFLHARPAFALGSEIVPLFRARWLWQQPSRLLMGIPFSASLMAILLSHEMGHFVYCEKYGVDATLPFFVPAPTLFGTFGAFIRIKSMIRTRQAWFDIGIAGPIAGFAVAVPLLLVGLALSKPLAPTLGIESLDVGFPLIFHIAHRMVGHVSAGTIPLRQLALHPIAVAAWAGMFATALNLLPGGQLDGGHIIYAVAPRAHKWVTWTAVVVLALLSVFWAGWLLWAVILGVTGWRHPRVAPWPGLDAPRRAFSVVALLMLVLTIVPAPILGQGLVLLR
jgi:membrane-associated protease RseP (regulator of RpoE activity)